MYKPTSSSQGLEYKNKEDRLKHCNLNSVSQRWKHTGLCTEAGEWKHSGNSPVITIRWLCLCLALRGHVWWPPVIVYGGSLNSASQGGNASLLQWALKTPLLLQYSLVPLLTADGPPPDAGYTHYGVLDGSIWWVCGRWGAERKHKALTKCPMDMFYILWHSLARTFSPLSTAPDLTAVALIRPACYLDTNGHGWYFTRILPHSHPASLDTSEPLTADNYQPCTWFFFLFFFPILMCNFPSFFGSPSWINAQREGKMQIQMFFFSSKEKAILSSVSKLHSASQWNNILNMQSNLIPFWTVVIISLCGGSHSSPSHPSRVQLFTAGTETKIVL